MFTNVTERIYFDSSDVRGNSKQNFKQALKALVSIYMQTHREVKHCWRLMEALIRVEVSTDTSDPKIMRQRVERESSTKMGIRKNDYIDLVGI